MGSYVYSRGSGLLCGHNNLSPILKIGDKRSRERNKQNLRLDFSGFQAEIFVCFKVKKFNFFIFILKTY